MPGLISQGITKVVEKAMKDMLEKIWPMVKYLIDRSIMIPVLAIGAIGAGVKYEYVTGDNGMWGVVIIAALVLISRIFNRKGPQ